MPLDLASFASVRRFVEDLRRKFPARAPSMLVNNAGLM